MNYKAILYTHKIHIKVNISSNLVIESAKYSLKMVDSDCLFLKEKFWYGFAISDKNWLFQVQRAKARRELWQDQGLECRSYPQVLDGRG